MTTKIATLVSAVFCGLLASHVNAGDRYSPAMFNFSGEDLAVQLASIEGDRDLSGGSAVLYCQSDLDALGGIQRTSCFDKDQNDGLVSSAEAVLSKLSFTQAKVNDKAVPVRVSYRIGVNQAKDGYQVVLIPNLGSMQDRYGRDYVAPQERLDVSDWYGRYNKASWVNGQSFLGHGTMSRVAATVNEKGKTELVRTMDDQRAYKRDANIVKNAVKKSRFIPGFVDGRPVPMGYLAVVNYGDSGEAVSSR